MNLSSTAALPITPDRLAQQVAEVIQQQWKARPRFGIVLGTGAGELADDIHANEIFPYESLPHFPSSTALGHKGQLVCGQLDGIDIVAMQGRFHLYEGYPVDQATLPIRVMQKLGIEVLFVSNASGGINPSFRSGDIMLIDSHIDLMFQTSPNMHAAPTGQRPSARMVPYDQALIAQALECGRQLGVSLHQGVYAGLLGPNYETRAEYRFLRRIGADVAGMSTISEVVVAAQYGLRVLGMSIVSNVAKPDVLEETSGQQVVDAAKVAAPYIKKIVSHAIKRN